MRSLFHLLLGGPPLVNRDYEICMERPPPTSKNAIFVFKIDPPPPGKRGLQNLNGTPPYNLKKCGKKLEICMKPLSRMGYEVSFPSIIVGIPPGKRGLRI